MRYSLFIIISILFSLAVCANDGVFFVNGSQLVPINETDIELTKEILTISLCDDGYAKIDVHYELTNPGGEKTVTMGFEAEAPYNDDEVLNKQGIHPYIKDFTAVMNGEPISYRNGIAASTFGEDKTPAPLDLNQWKAADEAKLKKDEWLENHTLYNAKLDSIVTFSYVYYFSVTFRPGLNTVHHTYRYRMSYGVGRTFEVLYWLTPAMRWANRQIDDFTLRIQAPNTAKHFLVPDSLFTSQPFLVTKGAGKVRKNQYYDGSCTEITLRNGTVEWHAAPFKPTSNLDIHSADILQTEHFVLGGFYDRSEGYQPWSYLDEKTTTYDKRILRNLPYASRGYVFKDQTLQDYFNALWWYMPDPAWETSTEDFTPREWQLINKGE
ncbi:MAG: YARHG domain-containing protein [Bacteroidaceae bacterium]|nr:YARHG domain-containing protein [Bacteroidaceae bacterium]